MPKPASGPDAALDRLEATFGIDAVRDLTRRLARALREGAEALDNQAGVSLAHRITGAAGTLGFAATAQAWLAVSEGVAHAAEAARSESRLAIDLIERRYGRSRQHTTSV